ncbi:MAG TPA: hypothetical protein VL992_08880 [Tepidisphaeraceae bacterium]|nr:hypothetical protein [Tepidisphaeraceae bacterium]
MSGGISFVSPVWLLGLFPWAAVVIFLLIGRRNELRTPYVDLWRDLPAQPSARRALQIPPLPVTALLLACMFALLAAAGPRLGTSAGVTRPVTIIVDRGITMSAHLRFQMLAASVAPGIDRLLGSGPVTLCILPDGRILAADRANWAEMVSHLDPAASDTREALNWAARRALLDPDAIAILLSDREIDVADPRLVQIAPADKLDDIAIAALSVRAQPRAQAMIGVLNDSSQTQATIRVGSAYESFALPPAGERRNYFVDLDSASDIVAASIRPPTDIAADQNAWAVRCAAWPMISPRCNPPAELQRLFDVYRQARPTTADSPEVAIIGVGSEFPAGEPSVAIVTEGMKTTPLYAAVQWRDSAITHGFDWHSALLGADVTAIDPPAGFQPLVWAEGRTLVAVSANLPRRLWVGVRPIAWARTPDFVIFWAKLLDSFGGSPHYESRTIKPMETLLPGLYQRDGQEIAINAPAVHLDPALVGDWQTQLSRLAGQESAGGANIAPWMIVSALALLVVAAARSGRVTFIHA